MSRMRSLIKRQRTMKIGGRREFKLRAPRNPEKLLTVSQVAGSARR